MSTHRLSFFGVCLIIIAGCSASKKSAQSYTDIQLKYSEILKVKPASIANRKLYLFIDEWLYTPYKWGGDDKDGIDCSAFIRRLLKDVYNVGITRTSIEQIYMQSIEKFSSKHQLSEGDLVFFKTTGDDKVSHVGLYLCNGKFVNAASSKGVTILSLNDQYWKERFVAAGRMKNIFLDNPVKKSR
jgi:cell wall-associated NlpC family hydrolase